MLLRIAIGWHFHHEGWEKIESRQKGEKSFSAEGYLRNSTGPLAPYFRGMIPDVNGLERLDPVRLEKAWREDVQRVGDHFGFDDAQREESAKALDAAKAYADAWFADREKAEKRAQYIHDLNGVQTVERDPTAMSYERERAAAKRKDLDVDRIALLKDLNDRAAKLRDDVTKLATKEQTAAAGRFVSPPNSLEQMNVFITYSVWAIGLCLILGLFTRLAALGGALFLLQIYLSMPPWPGLPPSPRAEGHYLIVDKNLVEMLACMALTFLPTGHWVGIDALLFGRRRHLRALARAEQEERELLAAAGRRI